MTRREALLALPAALPATAASLGGVSLGFSLYGMKNVPIDEALRICSRIGYDGVEMCLMPGWTPPEALADDTRRKIKSGLAENRLGLLALMEQLSLAEREMPRQRGIERLKRAAALGRALAPGRPLIETVAGGKAKDWNDSKRQLAERLNAWAGVAKEYDFLLCVKAHAAAAVDTPERLLWLYHQVNVPNLKLTYDYSHFQAAGLPLAGTLEPLIHDTRFIHVKDAKGPADHPHFLLVGDGGVDYEAYFRLLKKASYRGPIVAEVSAQLQHLPGYDAEYAASHSYQPLARAAKTTGLRRVKIDA
jgi:inosose dehydratase